MNKSLEKICEEKAHKYGREKIMQSCVGLPTWPQDYAQGFKDAIATLRCENCEAYNEEDGECNFLEASTRKSFGCTEFEKKESEL